MEQTKITKCINCEEVTTLTPTSNIIVCGITERRCDPFTKPKDCPKNLGKK